METADINKRQIKIYCLKDPKTLEIRYVGKTIQTLQKRLNSHISCSFSKTRKKYRVNCWIKSLKLS